MVSSFFFFNDTATTEIYTLSLHDALPILFRWLIAAPENSSSDRRSRRTITAFFRQVLGMGQASNPGLDARRSEEHTSELQSRQYLVCRLLLEKKKISDTQMST